MGLTTPMLILLAGAMTVIAVLPVLFATTRRRAAGAVAVSALPALGAWIAYALEDADLALGYIGAFATVLTIGCVIGVAASALRLWRTAPDFGLPLAVATACLSVFWVTVVITGL